VDGQAGRGRRDGHRDLPDLGLFTGVMAFLGVVLNLSFMFSGSAGVNPAFAIVGLLLVLAWRNAGWYGLDRWVLPRIGTLVPRRAVRPPGRRRRRGADHLIAAANPRRTPTHRAGVLPGWTATCT
jgi:hypothetical protein